MMVMRITLNGMLQDRDSIDPPCENSNQDCRGDAFSDAARVARFTKSLSRQNALNDFGSMRISSYRRWSYPCTRVGFGRIPHSANHLSDCCHPILCRRASCARRRTPETDFDQSGIWRAGYNCSSSSVQSAQQPNHQNDRQRNTNHPKKKSASHVPLPK